jgi:hypothetical protein
MGMRIMHPNSKKSDKMALGRYCQFGLNGKVQPGFQMLKLSDRISKLMPQKLKNLEEMKCNGYSESDYLVEITTCLHEA